MHQRLLSCFAILLALAFGSPLMGDDVEKQEPTAADSGEPAEASEGPAEGDSSEGAPSGEGDAKGGEAKGHDTDEHESDHEDGGHSGHGDPHDLSHANAGPKLNSPDDFRSDLAIWTFAVFVCLLAILGKFAWGPIVAGLDKREQSIAAMIDDAKQSQEKAAEQLKQYQEKIAAAGEEAREIVTQARKDAEAAGERIVAAAQAAAEKERERAVSDIATAKSAALDEIQGEGVNIAVQLAGQIVRRELNSQDHSQLIKDALDKLPSRN